MRNQLPDPLPSTLPAGTRLVWPFPPGWVFTTEARLISTTYGLVYYGGYRDGKGVEHCPAEVCLPSGIDWLTVSRPHSGEALIERYCQECGVTVKKHRDCEFALCERCTTRRATAQQ